MVSEEIERELDEQLSRFRSEVAAVQDGEALYELQVKYLGKKGAVTRLRSRMGALPPEQRKAFGQAFNRTKEAIEAEIGQHKETLQARARQAELSRVVDLTLLPKTPPVGSLHPVTRTRRRLEQVFRAMGFDVEDGPHVEHERYNFDDLNFLPDHPAREMQDTFFVRPPGADPESVESPLVLRTHTSPVQVRAMLGGKPPLKVVAMGTVFRRDDDATHSPMFHQIEGLRVDEGVSMADLKATLYRFVGAFFGTSLQVRFRPSYFPFVEPGAEFDIECPFGKDPGCSVCKGSGWIELGGSGMVHPNVLRAGGIDPERYTGWAFGFGIDRMAMMLHDIPHLRLLFEGDVRFLEQFPC